MPQVIPNECVERVVEAREISWNFSGEPPAVTIDTGFWRHGERVDPCPGYAHDTLRVIMQLAKCEERFPLPHPPKVFLLRHEVVGRVNGWTGHDTDYNKKDERGRPIQFPHIVLSGKRIPMHPAMTRYLVAHEYGHAVETFLAYARYSSNEPTGLQKEEYRKLRGLPAQKEYGPGTWHLTTGEVFANDFRVFVCGVEPEFWPHEVAPPNEVPAVMDWWKARLYDIAEMQLQSKFVPTLDVKLAT